MRSRSRHVVQPTGLEYPFEHHDGMGTRRREISPTRGTKKELQNLHASCTKELILTVGESGEHTEDTLVIHLESKRVFSTFLDAMIQRLHSSSGWLCLSANCSGGQTTSNRNSLSHTWFWTFPSRKLRRTDKTVSTLLPMKAVELVLVVLPSNGDGASDRS